MLNSQANGRSMTMPSAAITVMITRSIQRLAALVCMLSTGPIVARREAELK